jgi:DNA-binding NtrC family response regulator
MTNVISMLDISTKVSVLAVSGDAKELKRLQCLFRGSSWGLCTARTLAEAREWLNRNETPIILCDSRLPDGDWKGLFRLTADLDRSPSFIIISRLADERLWSELLNLGGHDVLALPAKPSELFGTLSNAWRSWKGRFEREPAAQKRHACSG